MAAPMGFFSEVVGKVAFVNKWPLLLKATQDDDTPTPGYMYKDISDLTYESSNSCQCLVEFLVDRLEKNSCHVKFKCLKIMLHVAERGHEAFSAALRRRAQGIQAATKYSGPPHALHGMAPYVAVRKIAKELSERLFDTEHESRRPAGHRGSPGGVLTAGGSKRLEGFGNTPVSPQRPVTVESLGETMKEGLQHIASKLAGEKRASLTSGQNDPGYRPLHGYGPAPRRPLQGARGDMHSSSSTPWATSQTHPRHYSAVKMGEEEEEEEENVEREDYKKKQELDAGKGEEGGSVPKSTYSLTAVESSTSVDRSQGEVVDIDGTSLSSGNLSLEGMRLHDVVLSSDKQHGCKSSPSDQLSRGSLDLSERLATLCSPDWSEETSTVESFVSCPASRQTPSMEEIQQFVKRCSSLNCHKMLELLTSHLQSSITIQLRCLFGMEGIIKEDLVSSDVALTLLSSHLRSVQSSQDKAVRSKAMKILRQLERLEADTNLDRPLIADSRLLTHQHVQDAEKTLPPPTGNSVPGSSLVDVSHKPAASDTESRSSALFSGMNLAGGLDADSEAFSMPVRTTVPAASSGIDRALMKAEFPTVGTSPMDSNPLTRLKASNSENLVMESTLIASERAEDPIGCSPNPHTSSHQGRINAANETQLASIGGAASDRGSSDPPTLQSSSEDAQRHTHADPILSRGAGFSDLLQTLSLGSPVKSRLEDESRIDGLPSHASGAAKSQTGMSMQPLGTPSPHAGYSHNPGVTSSGLLGQGMTDQQKAQGSQHSAAKSQRPGMTPQEIARLFPQLSKATLSGSSPTPLNLAAKPSGAFVFVGNPEDDKQNAYSTRDAFSFVQDAMKTSKK